MKIKNKLKLYENYLKVEDSPKTEELKQQEIEIPRLKEWEAHGVKPYIVDDEYCLIKEKRYSIYEKRGKYSFYDFIRAVGAWQTADVHHPLSSKGYQARDLFFFDTETTGLGGGVGNTIFLLGYAFVKDEEVIVRQHFLPKAGFEIPLYDSFLRSVDYTTLVTYNGKAFDWPQVKTRHTLIRDHVPKLPAFGHFDLLHASRRLWKNELEAVKLSIVEKEILGIERHQDVPGHLAPIIYFDFLETNELEGILKVMEHNEEDVLSLLILYTHISFQLLGLVVDQSKNEKLQVGQWYSSLKETKKAIEVLEEAVSENSHEEKWLGLLQLGREYKKINHIDQSFKAFKQVALGAREKLKIQACIEASKLLEHHYQDYEDAVYFCELAINELKSIKTMDSKLIKFKEDILHRMARIKRKCYNH